jgi:transposase
LRITGVDLVAVHGISDALAQTMLAEIGTDRPKWPTEKPCCSGLGLAPKKEIAGGKVLRSRTMQHRNGAAQACRMAAQSVSRSPGAFGACYRRMQGRLGPAQALVATAHKIARTVYHLLKDRGHYHDIGAAEYHNRFREREMPYWQKKAAKLGSTLSPASQIMPEPELFLSTTMLGARLGTEPPLTFPCPHVVGAGRSYSSLTSVFLAESQPRLQTTFARIGKSKS